MNEKHDNRVFFFELISINHSRTNSKLIYRKWLKKRFDLNENGKNKKLKVF
jgi:hypothetical protein